APVVRLVYGEEPRTQLKKIGQYIVIPLLSILTFLILWTQIAPRHKTKSGEVPTPSVVWNAAVGIWEFHTRENDKQRAFELTGDRKTQWLTETESRLNDLQSLSAEADRQVTAAEAESTSQLNLRIKELRSKNADLEARLKKEADVRVAELKDLTATLKPGDATGHGQLMAAVKANNDADKLTAERWKAIRNEEDEMRSGKNPQLVAARLAQTALAEEKQYLSKMSEQLSRANRESKVLEAKAKIDADMLDFESATGAEALALAKRLVAAEERADTVAHSEYAKPWTLPHQIERSLACVFFGFLLGSVIAIPIGILCGLNPTFMSAMTPFIALFKPVSPIVWLPIALIIVGGFIPDPDKHWFITLLADIPLIGRLRINPAFIASGVTVALCSLWPTLVNTALGVASIEKDHMNVARVLRLGFWSRMTKIVIPSALPLMFAGLRISLGVGWMVLIAAELLSSSEGLGKFIWDQFNNGASDSFARMVAVVFVVGAIGFLLDRIMIVLQRTVSFDGATAAL
ncbi:MAG: ABC transporter permease subunit, partial [Planctomycetota bacterium]|nr:ABC transporter permease subunit [Planctomycetota bacterium]